MDSIEQGKLDNYTLAELRALDGQVRQRMADLERSAIAEARAKIEEIARQAGMPLIELVGQAGRKGQGRADRARYFNPQDPSQSWSGLGRMPHWAKAWIADGRQLDELRK